MTLAEKLRQVASSLRTKPIPLSDFIPLLQHAADEIEATQAALSGAGLEQDD